MQCQGTTKKGNRCKKSAIDNVPYCATHGDIPFLNTVDGASATVADIAAELGIVTGGTEAEVLAECEVALGMSSMTGATVAQRIANISAAL